MNEHVSSSRRRALCVCGVLWASAFPGCGPRVPAGKVLMTGRVTIDGSSLPAGHRSFLLLQQREGRATGTAVIAPDGSFQVLLDPGAYGVVIDAKDGLDTVDSEGRVRVAKSVINARYDSLNTSGLSLAAVEGAEPVEIDLKR